MSVSSSSSNKLQCNATLCSQSCCEETPPPPTHHHHHPKKKRKAFPPFLSRGLSEQARNTHTHTLGTRTPVNLSFVCVTSDQNVQQEKKPAEVLFPPKKQRGAAYQLPDINAGCMRRSRRVMVPFVNNTEAFLKTFKLSRKFRL